MDAHSLDRVVKAARDDLDFAGLPPPQALLLLGTGVGVLPEHLRDADAIALDRVAAVPPPWDGATLHHGRLEGAGAALSVWLLDDLGGDGPGPGEPAWTRGFPCWLAARAGARVLVHTSAGTALAPPDGAAAPPVGGLAVVADHIDMSGRSPLVGLGPTSLGPLFPDLSLLHHPALRAKALAAAAELGVSASETIAACTIGPTRDTPAERGFYARAGAGVAVQGLAEPLLAAAHGGLVALALVAIVEAGAGEIDVAEVIARSQGLAPVVDDLLIALADDIAAVAGERGAAVEAGGEGG